MKTTNTRSMITSQILLTLYSAQKKINIFAFFLESTVSF